MPTKKPWFKKAVLERKPDTLEGWRKEMPAEKRRADAVASRPVNWTNKKKYLSAARALQALANVSKDPETKRLAKEDADYFFAKAKPKMENGGELNDGNNTEHYRYLDIQKVKNGLKVSLNEEGMEEVKELKDDGKSDWDIWYDLFEGVQGNSEYIFHRDMGESGFGLTNAEGITDGYYYEGEDRHNLYKTDYPKSAKIYWFPNYMVESSLDTMLKNGSVIFTEAKAAGGYMEKGGIVSEEKFQKEFNDYKEYLNLYIEKREKDKQIAKRAMEMLGEISEKSKTNPAIRAIAYKWISNGSTLDLWELSRKIGWGNIVNDSHPYLNFNAASMMDTVAGYYKRKDKTFGEGRFEKGGETQTLKVESQKDLEEVARYMTKAVKKHRWDLKDLVHYFENDNGFDYNVRVKIWDEMNMYEAPKTYDNILKLLEEIVKGNGKLLYSDNKKQDGGSIYEHGGSVNEEMIDQIAKGYMDAVLFTERDDDEEFLDKNYSNDDFDPETAAKIKAMIAEYILDNLEAIKASGIDYDTIGNDIWYAQSGAGAGFFDHHLDKEIENKLRKGAKKFVDLSAHVFAQDGKVYIEGGWFSKKFEEGGMVKSFINKFLDFSVLSEKVSLNEIFTKKIE